MHFVISSPIDSIREVDTEKYYNSMQYLTDCNITENPLCRLLICLMPFDIMKPTSIAILSWSNYPHRYTATLFTVK